MAAGTPTYPVGTIAKLLKLTERRVQQLTKDGVIPKAERGRYELAAAVQGYVTFLQDRVAGNPDATEGGADYQASRARKVAAEAGLAELEFAKARDDVVEVDVAMEEIGRGLDACRTRLLSIGANVAPMLAMETDASVCKQLVDAAVNEALHELSDYAPERSRRAEIDHSGADGGNAEGAVHAAADAKPK